MLRRLLLITIAVLPFAVLRVLLWRLFFGYRISLSSRVGWLTWLDCQEVALEDAAIGPFNFIQCRRLDMKADSHIGRYNAIRMLNDFVLGAGATVVNHNRFFGTIPGLAPFKNYENVTIGPKSIITTHHLIDVSDSVAIGTDVTFAGSGIQLWTHGFDLDHVKIQAPVSIGSHVYIGSGAIILAGVEICDRVSVGAGAVVSSSIRETGFYVSSHLQRKSDLRGYGNLQQVVEFKGARFVRK